VVKLPVKRFLLYSKEAQKQRLRQRWVLLTQLKQRFVKPLRQSVT
jgi:hypothetical protein